MYNNQIKKAFKLPKFVDPKKVNKFFGFIELEEWHKRVTNRIKRKLIKINEEDTNNLVIE